MKYCHNCGSEVSENQDICLKCGILLKSNATKSTINPNDDGSIGWGVLGFFVPIAGLILYLMWNESSPKNAKIAGKGALISTIISVSFSILCVIISIILIMTRILMY